MSYNPTIRCSNWQTNISEKIKVYTEGKVLYSDCNLLVDKLLSNKEK